MTYFGKWTEAPSQGGDPWGYYAYLPSLFIYKDIRTLDSTIARKKENSPNTVVVENGRLATPEAHIQPNGNRVIKYTSGWAMLNLPAFFLAHLFACNSGFEADGYTLPYGIALHLNAR